MENQENLGIEDASNFTITPLASKRISEIASKGDALRVEVLAGGCNGFQYRFDLTNKVGPDDIKFDSEGITVIVDSTSIELLKGAQLDYRNELMGSYFAINNPLAKSQCGCGTSFSL